MNKIILSFSINRIIKSKNFIFTTLIIFLMTLLANILIFAIIENSIEAAHLTLMLIIIFSIFWLSFLNINSIVNIIVKDNQTGIQGLELRRGVKPATIFLYKFLAVKIISFSFIILTYLLYISVLASFNFLHFNIILSSFSIGIFSLFAYDIFLFGIVLIITCIWKSNKKSIAVGWILTMLFAFHNILGPIIFVFSPGEQTFIVQNRTYIKNKYKEKDKNNEFISDLNEAYNKLENTIRENITCKDENNCNTLQNYFINLAFKNSGILIEFVDNFKLIEDYFKINFEIDINEELDLNKEVIKDEIEQNLLIKFLRFIAIETNSNYETNFKKSFYNSINSSNFNGNQQLEGVINNITEKDFNNFKNENQLDWEFNMLIELNDSIKQIFFSYLSIWSNEDIYYSPTAIKKFNFFDNNKMWINNTKYSFGTYLYSLSLFQFFEKDILSVKENKTSKDNYGNYKYNPFMLFYEMVYFSGSNNFLNDTIVLATSPLPLNNFREIIYNENNEMIVSKRPFIIWLNYLIFISLGITCSVLSFYRFKKDIYRKAGLD